MAEIYTAHIQYTLLHTHLHTHTDTHTDISGIESSLAKTQFPVKDLISEDSLKVNKVSMTVSSPAPVRHPER